MKDKQLKDFVDSTGLAVTELKKIKLVKISPVNVPMSHVDLPNERHNDFGVECVIADHMSLTIPDLFWPQQPRSLRFFDPGQEASLSLRKDHMILMVDLLERMKKLDINWLKCMIIRREK